MVTCYGGHTYGYYQDPEPTNIMEHLQLLKLYGEIELAESRLHLVAYNIANPLWLEEKEKEWLNEPKYWNGYYGEEIAGF